MKNNKNQKNQREELIKDSFITEDFQILLLQLLVKNRKLNLQIGTQEEKILLNKKKKNKRILEVINDQNGFLLLLRILCISHHIIIQIFKLIIMISYTI